MADTDRTRESVEKARSALEAEAEVIVRASRGLNDNLVEAVRRIWRQLLVIWLVVVGLAMSYLWVVAYAPTAVKPPAGIPLPEASRATEGSAAGPASTFDTFPPFPEREDLMALLNHLREAQYRKDIGQFMSYYAPSFPDLAKKRELTLNIWSRFDYLDMHYHVSDLQAAEPGRVQGKITWDIKARDRKTDAVKTLARSYQVQFSKESGRWLIHKLDALPD